MTPKERAHACAMQAREAFDVVREDEFRAFEDALAAEFEAVAEEARGEGIDESERRWGAIYGAPGSGASEAAAYARGRREAIHQIVVHNYTYQTEGTLAGCFDCDAALARQEGKK